jgi:hypothetical protein
MRFAPQNADFSVIDPGKRLRSLGETASNEINSAVDSSERGDRARSRRGTEMSVWRRVAPR